MPENTSLLMGTGYSQPMICRHSGVSNDYWFQLQDRKEQILELLSKTEGCFQSDRKLPLWDLKPCVLYLEQSGLSNTQTYAEIASTLNEINTVHREILVERICERIDKTIYKTKPLLESYETPDMQSFLKRYWPGTISD